MERPVVTVEHLTNSLGQIEYWIKAVRTALASLDPNMELSLANKDAKQWVGESPILTGKHCPPPE
jgi:hypothetical protein